MIPGDVYFVSFVINFCLSFCLSALIPARYVLSVLGSIAMAIIYGLKVNLSVAMVAMVNHTALALQNAGKHDESHDVTAYSMSNFTDSGREECDAKPRSSNSTTVNQVRRQIHLLRLDNHRTCFRRVISSNLFA